MTSRPAAIVAAGGRGERAASDSSHPNKQWRTLGGRPLIEWSLDLLAKAGCDPLVVVVPAEMVSAASDLAVGRSVEILVTAGGPTRQASVAAGLALVDCESVVVHDAARPFAREDLVRDVLDALADADGAIVALPVEETIKHVTDDRFETLDRHTLWRAQTPQAFKTDVLRRAHERAAADGFTGTDDAQLVENNGGRIAIVEGDPVNIKLTHPHDFVVAEALIKAGL